jgi:rhamnosyl/mannosyltransferase
VKELGLEQKIHFEENLSDDRRLALYHACRCFVLPSIAHAEGFGIVLAEAMACGRPVISTELMTGTSYVNLDGVTGYVVPPRDPAALAEKIDLLVGNAELSREMGDRGRMRSEQEFTRDIVTEKTIALYKNVLTG